MNSIRRATPDSEAVASSEDERPWPAPRSFGSLPRKDNGVPGLGGTIWTTQRRDSFKMEKAAQRNAAREARLAAPGGSWGPVRAEGTPSPAASDKSGALPFSIPSQPPPKAGRSMSHSQGQREMILGANEHTVLPLGLLTEEADTESESELGGGLTHTTSHPPIGTLQRTMTMPSTYQSYAAGMNGRGYGQAAGGGESRSDNRFETAFSQLWLDPPHRRSQWQSKLGWDDVPSVNESRRHSLADIPTRRGSLVGADNRPYLGGPALWPGGQPYEWSKNTSGQDAQGQTDAGAQALHNDPRINEQHNNAPPLSQQDYLADMKPFDLDENGVQVAVPRLYKTPFMKIEDTERTRAGRQAYTTYETHFPPNPNPIRPKKVLFIVSFKCARVDVCFCFDNATIFPSLQPGEMVIVEADRGQDLGTIQHVNVTHEEARILKKKYAEEQYKWLMMFYPNHAGGTNPNANSDGLLANAPASVQGTFRETVIKPKAIIVPANVTQIRQLTEKEGNEAKAKRVASQKAAQLGLKMEILDAELQWDLGKLIIYYYAESYIDFKDLVNELFRIYKKRIWMSAVNPASFSQHAIGQPPSGIGPGAIVPRGQQMHGYAMGHNQDPDPYGVIPPYNVGYETYNPNYPAIPGVINSFPPLPRASSTTVDNDPVPSLPPYCMNPTATLADYHYYYDPREVMNRERQARGLPPAFVDSGVRVPQPQPQQAYGQIFPAARPLPRPDSGNLNDRWQQARPLLSSTRLSANQPDFVPGGGRQ